METQIQIRKVAGKGIQILREHGIEVEIGILEKECARLNDVIFSLHSERYAVCGIKICDDSGWENCIVYGRIQVDHGRKSQGACTFASS